MLIKSLGQPALVSRYLATGKTLKLRNVAPSSDSQRNISFTPSLADQSGSGWFSKLSGQKIDTGKESHSSLLADADIVYELQTHDVIPGMVGNYLELYADYVRRKEALVGLDSEIMTAMVQQQSQQQVAVNASSTQVPAQSDNRKGAEFVGSWSTVIGDEDQVINIWRYRGGWATASTVQEQMDNPRNKQVTELRANMGKLLRARQTQFTVAFSFWGHPDLPSISNSYYELRTYILRPGTMIEWGNNWARGLQYRKSSAVLGMFSQIGQLYTVHHMWRYDSLLARKEFREDAWRKPGWDECVAYTVPLIREMTTRWMTPNSFSPIR